MTLHEKIHYYRKRAKLSQEELAARVGVSRQAVSKWELGDATPEVEKLAALARAFGVTTDELLSPEEPAGETPPPRQTDAPSHHRGVGGLNWMIRRYGWLAGVYVALSGAGITLVGALARFAFGRMFRITVGESLENMGWGVAMPQEFQGYMGMSAGVSSMGEVFLTIATAILAVGVVIIVAGVLLAVILYQKGRKGD